MIYQIQRAKDPHNFMWEVFTIENETIIIQGTVVMETTDPEAVPAV